MMNRIPKILHYTFGLAKDFGGMPWSLAHHVCLKSAVERIRPERVFFYYEYEPAGPWWDLSRDLVIPVQIEAPREVFGRPLSHVAHRADVVRLQKLIEHGGIYLDADVLVQRSFDELLGWSTVLGAEGVGAEVGLANAVILAEQNAPFLNRWLDSYRSFRGHGRREHWNEHSVKLPCTLAKAYPLEITVLPHTAFFWPLCTPEHLDWIFKSTQPISLACCYANHLWESSSGKFLKGLTPGQVRGAATNFHAWAKPFVADLPDEYGASSLRQRLFSQAKQETSDIGRRIKIKAKRSLAAIERKTREAVMTDGQLRRRVFRGVYRNKLWGSDDVSEFFSGAGSKGPAAEFYVEQMAKLLEYHWLELRRPLRIVDLGCGDFRVGKALVDRLPGTTYVGCDIVPELVARNKAIYADERVSFQCLDAVCDPLPEGDVCLARQVFQHLSNADILAILDRMIYPIVYVSEGHPVERVGAVNPDKTAGADVRFNWRTGQGRGVELDQPPYSLNTCEVFRVSVPPGEIIVTERVDFAVMPASRPGLSTGASAV